MASRTEAPAASEQPTLFHGSLDINFELRYELNIAITMSRLTRKEIAERMADLSATKVTVAMLNAWTAPSRTKWNMPIRLAVAFDVATDGTRVLDFLARKRGRTVLSPEEALDAELGAITRQEEKLRRRRAEIIAAQESKGGAR